MDSTLLQPYEFSAFLYGGLVLGLLIEGFSRLRALLPNRYFGHAADFLLLLFSGFVVFATFYLVNGGQFRLFGALSITAGVLLVHGSVGKLLPKPKRAFCIRKKSML